jgi:hypothetical protein
MAGLKHVAVLSPPLDWKDGVGRGDRLLKVNHLFLGLKLTNTLRCGL